MPHEAPVILNIQLIVQVEVNDIQQVKQEQLKHVHVRTVVDERGGSVEQLLFPPWENHVTQMICDRVNGHIPHTKAAELVQTAEQTVPEPGSRPTTVPLEMPGCRVIGIGAMRTSHSE
jgi:hypothetical protein